MLDANEIKRLQAQKQAKELRYKRSALSLLGWDTMYYRLQEIMEECSDITYAYSPEDVIDAFDGDEEQAWEFQIAFTSLSDKADQLYRAIEEFTEWDEDPGQKYDDCTVALIGNRYDVVGFDSYEEDYFSLCRFEADLAETEAGKRIMRWTKKEMIANIGQSIGIMLSFFDLQQQYDYIKAEMDALRGESMAVLETIKQIEEAYDKEDWKTLDRMAQMMPQRVWLE